MALTKRQWDAMTDDEWWESGIDEVEPCTEEERERIWHKLAQNPELQRIRREFIGFLGATF